MSKETDLKVNKYNAPDTCLSLNCSDEEIMFSGDNFLLLIKQHNKLVDLVNELLKSTKGVSNE